MKVLLIISIISLLLTYFDSKSKLRNGMKCAFILLAFIAAIHYNYGSDYPGYKLMFDSLEHETFTWDNLLSFYYYDKDPGWIFLCFLFRPFGFYAMVAVLSIFQNCVYYRFIKNNVERQWWPLAVFMYLFLANDLYVINMSMMRQGLTVSMFAFLIDFIRKKKVIPSLLVGLLACSFHSSALVILPFLFWWFVPVEGKACKIIATSILIGFVTLLLSGKFLNDIFTVVTQIERFDTYAEHYAESEEFGGFGLGFLLNCIPLVLSVYYLWIGAGNNDTRHIVSLAAIGMMVLPFVQIVPLISRVGIYFSAYSLAALPLIYANIKNKLIRSGLLAIYIVITLYTYWKFFNVGVYVASYSEFHSIFELL